MYLNFGMRKVSTFILFLLFCSVWVCILDTAVIKADSYSLVTVKDEQFIIHEVVGGFSNFFVGSFNASDGYWIELNISSYSTNNEPSSLYLDILSANHGKIFSGRGTEFSQTVYLDYEDVYNITIAKIPFYSNVRINGKIDVFHQEPVGQSSSENWVEVDRFTGGSWNGGTRPFIINHIEWRIRWNYEPTIDVDLDIPMGFHFMVMDVDHNYIDIVFGDEEKNGTLYLNQDGEFYLDISGLHVEYTIIVEENIESIPEFPSWLIPPLLIVATLVGVIIRNKIRKNELE